jgi:aspartate/tyrosine/aromatic aminotransferase
LAKAHEDLTNHYRNSAQQLAAAGVQIEAEKAVSLKLKAEWEAKLLELEEKIRQMEASSINSL